MVLRRATSHLENGVVVGMAGAWQAAVDGVKPGIVMEANPKVGDSYRQEFALGDAEDAATVKSLTRVGHRPLRNLRSRSVEDI